jgi:hypothetical protein
MAGRPKSRARRLRNPGIGDYFRAGKKAALSAAEEAESRKADSPEKALRILAAAHGYELVKKNRGRARKNPGCSCGGKCAPCASRKRRRRAAR